VALKWFEVHADQRMKFLQYYLTASGLLVATAGLAIHNVQRMLATLFCMLLILLCLLFKALDRRTSYLIKVAEKALEKTTAQIVITTGIMELDIVGRSEATVFMPTYRQTLNGLFWFFALTGLVGICVAWAV